MIRTRRHPSPVSSIPEPRKHQRIASPSPDIPVEVIYVADSDEELMFDSGEVPDVDDEEEDNGFDEDEAPVLLSEDEHEPTVQILDQAMLDDDVLVARAILADSATELRQIDHDIFVTLPLAEMPPLARAACGLSRPDPLDVILEFGKGYRRTSPLPIIRVRHGQPQTGRGIETSSDRATAGFPIGLQLSKAAEVFLRDRWSGQRGESFLADLSLLLEDRLFNAGNTCLMCDTTLPFPGVKPTVCDATLCTYQLEQLGLGADLSLLEGDPAVADLLVTACVAALNDTQRQTASPVATPLNKVLDAPYTIADLRVLLDQLPSAAVLHDAGDSRAAIMQDNDPASPAVLAWIFATNRAHIVSVAPEKRIPGMGTDLQFQIHTSTRKHAEKFEIMRAKHGSIYAFHGSSMANWHNILRQNLRNASNTPLMSAGAAYGPGIYLAANSDTSKHYARPVRGWAQSDFGHSPMCLGLVEVANSSGVHRHAGTGIIVASDESCVMLRYLFIYRGTASMPNNISAQSLARHKHRNQKTIAAGATLEEVSAEGKLLVTSDDYFWDIDEVVQMVIAKNGLFINGYTQLPFNNADIKKIINHPSGAGQELVAIEEANRILKHKIPPSVYSRLHLTGGICRTDNTADFAAAHQAIHELKTWTDSLDTTVKHALSRVPFSAVDTHTGLAFRDTVMHALELVISGGECVHRFGDFLTQTK